VWSRVSPLRLTLRITLNGQQFTPPIPFVITGSPPLLLGVRPASGPSAGGVLVLLSGLLLGDGSDYRCRFGASFVPATYERTSGAIRCFAPPHPAGTFNLSYSLNGRHFENASDATFHFYPEPSLASVVPASGPAFAAQCQPHACGGGGRLGTRLVVSGVGLDAGLPYLRHPHPSPSPANPVLSPSLSLSLSLTLRFSHSLSPSVSPSLSPSPSPSSSPIPARWVTALRAT